MLLEIDIPEGAAGPAGRTAPGRRDVVVAVAAAALLTAASYGLGIAAGWISGVEWLEALAVATSYASTALCIVQRRFNYVFGAVSTALYAALFFRHGLVASAFLNVYLTPQLVYGWVRWRRDDQTRPVTWLVHDKKWIPAYLGVTVVAYLGGAWLVGLLDGQLAWADSAILAGSILAQLLLDNKRIETWFVWIAVNVIAVWTYFTAGLVVAGLQYVIFIGTAVLGFIAWLRATR
ncbi:nicotinamide riboside transporter PnuC [Cellulomonas gilvus]|uniref:Nicotinamide mononucleotide transporter PnuC n=1 Tax=Cellulomonas gilvus (strain ATCC 13127 / NRRL B-14078) TaxID=593907 RepID=F8A1H3_CELGA|nr:nicotinamide riboside transporter PnuC [Cellulomonas gilvus]AEI12857.1 nicotinamide mononucleotide transporter PnuC [Cellulomonas gilvus ATCC 13127]